MDKIICCSKAFAIMTISCFVHDKIHDIPKKVYTQARRNLMTHLLIDKGWRQVFEIIVQMTQGARNFKLSFCDIEIISILLICPSELNKITVNYVFR